MLDTGDDADVLVSLDGFHRPDAGEEGVGAEAFPVTTTLWNASQVCHGSEGDIHALWCNG